MIVDEAQKHRLKEYGINIKTKYKADDKILERNTDCSRNDNIKQGIILEKDYYSKTLLKKEKDFDSRILYTYEFNESKNIKCNNCGAISDINTIDDHCPYCNSSFNIEYNSKELGSKHYYDLIIKDKTYIIKTYIMDFVISLIISSIYIISTSRTFYFFDILKIVVATVLISLLLFYVFYYLDALILLPSLKRKKELQNQNQKDFFNELSKKNLDKITFYNNLLYELRELYYSDKYKNIIDFDIIDYNSFKLIEKNNNIYVDVSVDIRIIEYKNQKIVSKRTDKKYRMLWARQNDFLSPGENQIKCHNCSSSIDVREQKCKYCGTKINYYQQWYLDKELD